MRLHAQLVVAHFEARKDPRAAEAQLQIRLLLAQGDHVLRRDFYQPGHVTASGLVLSKHGVLLVFHRRLQRWLQPGGHIDPTDNDTIATARREVLEETGVEVGKRAELVGLDVHQIPAARGEPDHLHHDLVYRFEAITTELTVSDESSEVRWCPVDELEALKPDAALRSAVQRALGR